MNLLFKRDQVVNKFGRPIFKLWAKVEFEGSEEAIIKHYRFEETMMIEAIQPELLRMTSLIGVGVFVLVFVLCLDAGWGMAASFGFLIGGGASWLYFDRNRDTIYVKDLIHGRYFDCKTVVELARKEAWLSVVASYLRQVMESAKHWDGTETVKIEVLNKQESKYAMIRGL